MSTVKGKTTNRGTLKVGGLDRVRATTKAAKKERKGFEQCLRGFVDGGDGPGPEAVGESAARLHYLTNVLHVWVPPAKPRARIGSRARLGPRRIA